MEVERLKIQWLKYPTGKLHAVEDDWRYPWAICGIMTPTFWWLPQWDEEYCKTCKKKMEKIAN